MKEVQSVKRGDFKSTGAAERTQDKYFNLPRRRHEPRK